MEKIKSYNCYDKLESYFKFYCLNNKRNEFTFHDVKMKTLAKFLEENRI